MNSPHGPWMWAAILLAATCAVGLSQTSTNAPSDVGSLQFQLGEALAAHQKWDEAVAAYSGVPKDHPRYPEAIAKIEGIRAQGAASTNASPFSVTNTSLLETTPPLLALTPEPAEKRHLFKGKVTIEQKIGESDIRRNRANIVVWLAREGLPPPPPTLDAKLEQKHKAFIPRVLAVAVGSAVDFPSNDTIFHNVFSLSKTKPFDLGLYKKPKSSSVVFDKPGLVEVYCNIHQDMAAYIWVMDTPYFAITDSDGNFEIPNALSGHYHLRGWHERAPKLFDQEIEVNADQTDLSITMTDDPELADKKHPRKDGSPYRNATYGDDSAGPANY